MDPSTLIQTIPTIKRLGTRLEVYEGNARRTSGGLTKDSLVFDDILGLLSVKELAKLNARPAKKEVLCVPIVKDEVLKIEQRLSDTNLSEDKPVKAPKAVKVPRAPKLSQ